MELTKKQKIIISAVFFMILLVVFGGLTIGKYIVLQQEGRYASADDLEDLNNVIVLAEDEITAWAEERNLLAERTFNTGQGPAQSYSNLVRDMAVFEDRNARELSSKNYMYQASFKAAGEFKIETVIYGDDIDVMAQQLRGRTGDVAELYNMFAKDAVNEKKLREYLEECLFAMAGELAYDGESLNPEDAEAWAFWEAGPAFRAYDFEKYSSRYDDSLGYRYRLELSYSGIYK